MYEVFPVLAGVSLGLVLHFWGRPWLRGGALLAVGVGLGVMAALVSGELLVSWSFVIVDTALVLLAAAVTVALAAWWQRHAGRLS